MSDSTPTTQVKDSASNDSTMFYFILDRHKNLLHGADGGPFPFLTIEAAKKAVTARNFRELGVRYKVVGWIAPREVAWNTPSPTG